MATITLPDLTPTMPYIRALQRAGYYVGLRDPNRNRAFAGHFMVAQTLVDEPTDDASQYGFCVVGDDLHALAFDACQYLELQVETSTTRDGDALDESAVERRRTAPDSLTLAYVAIGAHTSLVVDSLQPIQKQLYRANDWDGQMGFIEAVTNHALLLDQLADLVGGESGFTGVFLYDVAMPFGLEFGNALLADPTADPRPIAERLIEEAQA